MSGLSVKERIALLQNKKKKEEEAPFIFSRQESYSKGAGAGLTSEGDKGKEGASKRFSREQEAISKVRNRACRHLSAHSCHPSTTNHHLSNTQLSLLIRPSPHSHQQLLRL